MAAGERLEIRLDIRRAQIVFDFRVRARRGSGICRGRPPQEILDRARDWLAGSDDTSLAGVDMSEVGEVGDYDQVAAERYWWRCH